MVLLRRVLLVIGLFAAGAAAAWLILPTFITPDEAEAVREPPEPKPITAPVEVGVLREVLILKGEIRPQIEISVAPWEPADASRPVLTYLPKAEAEIRSGDVIAALSGRPLIFVSGLTNLYRDLHRGLFGTDVEDLQTALIDLGYLDDPEDLDGVFGAETEDAVTAWYVDLGYLPAAPPAEVTTVSVLEAENAVDQARQGLSDARGGNSTAVATARRSLAIAEAQLAALESAPRLSLPANEILGLTYTSVVVEGSPYREGDLVAPETPLLQLRTSEMLVVASATLAQTSRLSEGQPVLVQIEGREATATVGEVVVAEPGSTTEAFVRIEADVAGVPPSTPVTVEVELEATTAEVVSVPVSAVRTDADGTSHVTVIDGQTQTEVPVEVGATIGGRTEIISGLGGDEMVVVG